MPRPALLLDVGGVLDRILDGLVGVTAAPEAPG
jgi:hypothetical protein